MARYKFGSCCTILYRLEYGSEAAGRGWPEAVVAKTLAQYESSPVYGNKPSPEHHFDALKRMLARKEPDYLD